MWMRHARVFFPVALATAKVLLSDMIFSGRQCKWFDARVKSSRSRSLFLSLLGRLISQSRYTGISSFACRSFLPLIFFSLGRFRRGPQFKALEATADCVEACFRRVSSPSPAVKEEQGEGNKNNNNNTNVKKEQGGRDEHDQEGKNAIVAGAVAVIPSSEAFDEDISWRLATAVMRSLRFFRAAAAGTGAASVPGEGVGQHTPAVAVLADGTVTVDDGPRQIALAGLRLAGAVATAPGPARALLEAGGFHVLWRLPLDPAATPAGVALALGALCQGVRHVDVLRVFLTRSEGIEAETSPAEGAREGGAGLGLATMGGYEACASVLSRQVRTGGGERERGERRKLFVPPRLPTEDRF